MQQLDFHCSFGCFEFGNCRKTGLASTQEFLYVLKDWVQKIESQVYDTPTLEHGYVFRAFRQFRPMVLIKPLRQCGESETETVELQALGCVCAGIPIAMSPSSTCFVDRSLAFNRKFGFACWMISR